MLDDKKRMSVSFLFIESQSHIRSEAKSVHGTCQLDYPILDEWLKKNKHQHSLDGTSVAHQKSSEISPQNLLARFPDVGWVTKKEWASTFSWWIFSHISEVKWTLSKFVISRTWDAMGHASQMFLLYNIPWCGLKGSETDIRSSQVMTSKITLVGVLRVSIFMCSVWGRWRRCIFWNWIWQGRNTFWGDSDDFWGGGDSTRGDDR